MNFERPAEPTEVEIEHGSAESMVRLAQSFFRDLEHLVQKRLSMAAPNEHIDEMRAQLVVFRALGRWHADQIKRSKSSIGVRRKIDRSIAFAMKMIPRGLR